MHGRIVRIQSFGSVVEPEACADVLEQARDEDRDIYAWFVLRHEIDYRGNVTEGAVVTGTTEILEGPKGPRFNRHYRFTDSEGRELVRAKTTWAMIDKASGKLMRVPGEVAAPFMPAGGWG